jgi:glutamate--cysteine ligase
MSDYIADDSGPDAAPIERFEQLYDHFARGCKPRSEWRVGTEFEKVVVDRRSGGAIPYSGNRGVEAILRALADQFGWEPHDEEGRIIALSRDGSDITLEPGGQIELSGKAYESLHDANREVQDHLRELASVAAPLDVEVLGLGMQPISPLEEIEWVPKRRYGIMAPYMAKVGSLGHRMMKQTATVQVNFDFASEADAMQKMRVAMGIGPILNALFANSPLCDGKLNGYLSYRGHIWTDTDAARCGVLPFVFNPGAGFAEYAEWALDAPMYFVKRRGEYRDMTGIRFRDYWRKGHGELRATVGDFALHLSTLFPEVRLKTYIELRMVDTQPLESLLALSAMTKGIFYEPDCMLGAWDLVKGWSWEERLATHLAAHRQALQAPIRRLRLQDLARELVDIAEEGLHRARSLDAKGGDEAIYLGAARDYARRGRPPAQQIAERWEGEWKGDPARLVAGTRYAV